MRYFAFAALAMLAVGLTDVRPASAAWECTGPAVACSDAPRAAKKAAYKKASHKKAAYKKAAYKKTGKKQAYKKSTKRYASYKKKRNTTEYSGSYGGSSGIASYYWQGQRTASGARFNPDGLTAAHRTLPFGTRVLVTNHSNGRSVTVTINDRGPFIKGRVIDLSRGAAAAIGMTGAGLARVSYTVVGRG